MASPPIPPNTPIQGYQDLGQSILCSSYLEFLSFHGTSQSSFGQTSQRCYNCIRKIILRFSKLQTNSGYEILVIHQPQALQQNQLLLQMIAPCISISTATTVIAPIPTRAEGTAFVILGKIE